jgi:hypothetical protein
MWAFIGLGLLIITGVLIGFLSLVKREEPTGCIIFFAFMFLSCMAVAIIPQVVSHR